MSKQYSNNKIRSRKPLAILIGAVLFSPAYAADWSVADGEYDEIEINNGSVTDGKIIIGVDSTGAVILDGGSTWNGDVIQPGSGDDATALIYVNGQSTWDGKIIADPNRKFQAQLSVTDSNINTDVSLKGWFEIEANNGHVVGNIAITGAEDDESFSDLTFEDNSTYRGDISSEYSHLHIEARRDSELYSNIDARNGDFMNRTREGSLWQGNVTGNNLGIDVWVDTNSEWLGNVTNNIVMGTYNSGCACITIDIDDNSRWTGNATVDFDGAGTGDHAFTGIHLSQSSLWEGDLKIDADNSTIRFYSDVSLDDNSLWKGDAVFTGLVESAIYVADSLWEGNLTFNDAVIDPNFAAPATVMLDTGKWTGHINSDNAYAAVWLGGNSDWTLTGSSKLINLEMNADSKIVFESLSGNSREYHTLSVEDFESEGQLVMRAGYYGPGDYGNDKLIITGDKNVTGIPVGSTQVTVVNNGTDNTHGTETITMIETVDGLDQFTATSDVELGGYVYSLEQDSSNWILRPGTRGGSWTPGISNPADAGANIVNVNYLLTYAETQTLHQRMGDLRQSNSSGDFWLRGYHGGFDKFSSGMMRGFDMHYNGMQMGVDKLTAYSDDRFYFGVMAGMTDSNQNYQTGKGSAKNYHAGLYGSYVMANGFYVDGLVKYHHASNKFNVADSAGAGVSGKSDSDGASASVEIGRRFHFSDSAVNSFYIEPQAQFSTAYQESSSVKISNGLRVDLDSYTSMQGAFRGAFWL